MKLNWIVQQAAAARWNNIYMQYITYLKAKVREESSHAWNIAVVLVCCCVFMLFFFDNRSINCSKFMFCIFAVSSELLCVRLMNRKILFHNYTQSWGNMLIVFGVWTRTALYGTAFTQKNSANCIRWPFYFIRRFSQLQSRATFITVALKQRVKEGNQNNLWYYSTLGAILHTQRGEQWKIPNRFLCVRLRRKI